MSKGNTFENDFLLLVLNNTNIALIGDATGLRGATAVGNLYLALHTADVGEAGAQNTSEAAYTGYARVAVARSAAQFSVASGVASLVNNHDFGTWTAGATTNLTHWSLGTDSSGAGKVLWKGALSAAITPGTGVTPRINAGTIITED